MSFILDSYNGYDAGMRYEKHLKFVQMSGDSKKRYIVMRDEEGNELHWNTNDYTKAYKNFKMKAVYRFTVSFIIKHNKEISIKHLTLVE